MKKQGVKQRTKILGILSEKKFVSGEEIAKLCKISRIATWKHINYLIKNGVRIKIYPNRGYEFINFGPYLLPEVINLNLKSSEIVNEIIYLEEIDSTNEYAKKVLKEGRLIIAEEQKRGKGRLGRNWYSQKYKDILFSIIFSPKLSYPYLGVFNTIGVLSVVRALRKLYRLNAYAKWPNDVLVEGKKISGVLVEFFAQTDLIDKLILGIGIDVNSQPKLKNAVSIKKLIFRDVNRIELLVEIIRELERYYKLVQGREFKKIRKEWLNYSIDYLQKITLLQEENRLKGISRGIDESGNLILTQGRKRLIIPPINDARLELI